MARRPARLRRQRRAAPQPECLLSASTRNYRSRPRHGRTARRGWGRTELADLCPARRRCASAESREYSAIRRFASGKPGSRSVMPLRVGDVHTAAEYTAIFWSERPLASRPKRNGRGPWQRSGADFRAARGCAADGHRRLGTGRRGRDQGLRVWRSGAPRGAGPMRSGGRAALGADGGWVRQVRLADRCHAGGAGRSRAPRVASRQGIPRREQRRRDSPRRIRPTAARDIRAGRHHHEQRHAPSHDRQRVSASGLRALARRSDTLLDARHGRLQPDPAADVARSAQRRARARPGDVHRIPYDDVAVCAALAAGRGSLPSP